MRFYLILLLALLCSLGGLAQNRISALPHGMVFGNKPDTTTAMAVHQLQKFMGDKTRIITVLKGQILKVTKEKGGWFIINAGDKNTFSAHFQNYNINLPSAIAGRIVIIDVVAKKVFDAANNQHFVGDTNASPQSDKQPTPTIVLEVRGLMVYQ